MNERIKQLRKVFRLTQQEFADKLRVSRSNIATYEVGKNNPTDAVISLICREFNVDEVWLRTGEGEMFVQQEPEDELAAAVERLITGESAEFKRRLVLALSSLKDEHWALLEQKLNEIIGQRSTAVLMQDNKAPVEPKPQSEPESDVTEDERLAKIMTMDMGEMTEEEFGLFTRELRRQAIEEKKAEENARALQAVTWRRKEA